MEMESLAALSQTNVALSCWFVKYITPCHLAHLGGPLWESSIEDAPSLSGYPKPSSRPAALKARLRSYG